MKRLLSLTALSGLAALLLSACGRPDSLPPGSAGRAFSSSEWRAPLSTDWRESGVSVREAMLEDLVLRVLPGKSRSEIEALLGPSLETPYFRSLDKDLIYYLGPERGHSFNIDSEWLLIWLDPSGRFHHYRILND